MTEHITDPGENDVIWGTSERARKHQGNKRYRDFISSNAHRYEDAKRNDKKRVAQQIFQEFQQLPNGGRILKEIDGSWCDIGNDASVSKVQQDCRDNKKKLPTRAAIAQSSSSTSSFTAETSPSTDDDDDDAAMIPSEEKTPVELSNNDVICNDRKAVNNQGNILYRDFVSNNFQDFRDASSKEAKKAVAQRTVNNFQDITKGRFIEKLEDGLWYEIGNVAAIEKTKQAFRDRARTAAEPTGSAIITNATHDSSENNIGIPPRHEVPPTHLEAQSVAMSATTVAADTITSFGNVSSTSGLMSFESIMGKTTESLEQMVASGFGAARQVLPGFRPIMELATTDVVWGSESEENNQEGNRLYQDFISSKAKEYKRASVETKKKVAKGLVDAFRLDVKARFLERGEDGHWYEIGDKVAVEKTQQVLKNKKARNKNEATNNVPPDGQSMSLGSRDVSMTSGSMTSSSFLRRAPSVFREMGSFLKNVAMVLPGQHPTDLRPDDVILGRASEALNQQGNGYFRQLVGRNVEEYKRASAEEKKEMTKGLVNAYRQAAEARFLERGHDGKWYEIGDKAARKMTERTFQDEEKVADDVSSAGRSMQSMSIGSGDISTKTRSTAVSSIIRKMFG